jgi:hypothetical protein
MQTDLQATLSARPKLHKAQQAAALIRTRVHVAKLHEGTHSTHVRFHASPLQLMFVAWRMWDGPDGGMGCDSISGRVIWWGWGMFL